MSRVVIALNYYAPYVSGLTNVARDVAEALAERGHAVTVVTSQHDRGLPKEEVLRGVRVVRCPVRIRFGKGVVAPGFIRRVIAEARDADVVNIHAPMLEAGPIARRLARLGRPLVYTYHCDIALPDGVLGRVQSALMDASSRAAARRAAANIVSSADYAAHSRIAAELRSNQLVIAPGCHDRTGGSPSFRSSVGLHIGFLGRIVEEKGIEYLVDGFLRYEAPDARLLIGGDFANIAGGSVIERVRERIGSDPRVQVLGFIDEVRLPDFYASLDAFALVSVNSFEAFGIVQVEGMIAGVPALASDMPGVRRPVQETGFGVIVPPRDAGSVTDALSRLAEGGFDRAKGADAAERLYGIGHAVDAYEALVAGLVEKSSGSPGLSSRHLRRD